MSTLTKVIIVVVFILIIVHNFTKDDKPKDPNYKFESTWHSVVDNNYFITIGKLMVANNIRGCGEMYIKESTENKNEFLLACSSDGIDFTYYLVWPKIDEIMRVKDEGFDKPKN